MKTEADLRSLLRTSRRDYERVQRMVSRQLLLTIHDAYNYHEWCAYLNELASRIETLEYVLDEKTEVRNLVPDAFRTIDD